MDSVPGDTGGCPPSKSLLVGRCTASQSRALATDDMEDVQRKRILCYSSTILFLSVINLKIIYSFIPSYLYLDHHSF
jgi:hypothetical protein